MTYAEAADFCSKKGLYVAIPKTQSETNEVRSILPSGSDVRAWVGIQKKNNRWTPDNPNLKKITWLNFGRGEGNTGERNAAMIWASGWNGQWYDIDSAPRPGRKHWAVCSTDTGNWKSNEWITVFHCAGNGKTFARMRNREIWGNATKLRLCVDVNKNGVHDRNECVTTSCPQILKGLTSPYPQIQRPGACNINCIKSCWQGDSARLGEITRGCGGDRNLFYHACGNSMGLHIERADRSRCNHWNRNLGPVDVEVQIQVQTPAPTPGPTPAPSVTPTPGPTPAPTSSPTKEASYGNIIKWLKELIDEGKAEIVSVEKKTNTLKNALDDAKDALVEAQRKEGEDRAVRDEAAAALSRAQGAWKICKDKFDSESKRLEEEIAIFEQAKDILNGLLNGKELVEEEKANVEAFISLKDQANPDTVKQIIALLDGLITAAKDEMLKITKDQDDCRSALEAAEQAHARAIGIWEAAKRALEEANADVAKAQGAYDAQKKYANERIAVVNGEIAQFEEMINILKPLFE